MGLDQQVYDMKKRIYSIELTANDIDHAMLKKMIQKTLKDLDISANYDVDIIESPAKDTWLGIMAIVAMAYTTVDVIKNVWYHFI